MDEAKLKELRERVLSGDGALEPALRTAAFLQAGLPPELSGFAEKIEKKPYAITDQEVEALKKAGWSDDQIFELAVSAALGAGMRRFEVATRARKGAG